VKHKAQKRYAFLLGFLAVLGFFNRITSLAFLLVPGVRMVSALRQRQGIPRRSSPDLSTQFATRFA
jgi:hypothetical protein